MPPIYINGQEVVKRYVGISEVVSAYVGSQQVFSSGLNPLELFAAGEQGIWYDLSDFSTLFQDSAGTTPVTAAGQPIGKIIDKSGRGNHATQPTAGSRPTLQQDAHGRYFIQGNGRWMFTGAINFSATDKISMWSIDRNMSSSLCFPIELTADSTVNNGAFCRYVDGGENIGLRGTVFERSLTTTPTTPFTRMYHYALDIGAAAQADELACRINGGVRVLSVGVAGPAGGGNFANAAINILARNGGSYPMQGGFYEIIVRGAETADSAPVEAYFKNKHAFKVVADIGDSVISAYSGTTAVSTLTERLLPTYIAVPGNTINQQKTAWNALSSVIKTSHDVVVVQVGLNDLEPTESASLAIARLQSLIDTINADVTCPVFVSQMTPCRARLITMYGATNGPVAYQKWLDINTAIAGSGGAPITGVDGRITSHVALMNDGAGNLAAGYDSGDGIHPNNAGRQINANAWVSALSAAGVL